MTNAAATLSKFSTLPYSATAHEVVDVLAEVLGLDDLRIARGLAIQAREASGNGVWDGAVVALDRAIDIVRNGEISRRILAGVAAGLPLDAAFDAVMGAGAYAKVAGDVYEDLRARDAKTSNPA